MKLDLPYFDICVANIPYQVHAHNSREQGFGQAGQSETAQCGAIDTVAQL